MNKLLLRLSTLLSGLLLSTSVLAQGSLGNDDPPPPPPPDRVPGSGFPDVGDGGQEPWENYAKQIQSRNVVGALGPDLFGDEVNLYNGALSFRQTDAAIPGNFALPVSIVRTFSVAAREEYALNDGAFGDWELDIPRLEGTFGLKPGTGQTWVPSRCSGLDVAPSITVAGGATYTALDYYTGVQAQMPGGGELLRANVAATPKPSMVPPGGYQWVTPSYTYFSCLSGADSATDGGEGFLAITSDGTKYWFRHMARFFEAPLARQMDRLTTHTGTLDRHRVALYATRVEDRFGNWVQYSYGNTPTQPLRLNSITASDNRMITLTHNPNGHVSTVTENNRTWTYSYSTAPGRKSLISVVRTDSLNPTDSWQWSMNLKALSDSDIEYSVDGPSQCDSLPAVLGLNVAGTGGGNGQVVSGQITHPSGAEGKFDITYGLVRRTNVPDTCLQVRNEFGQVTEEYPNHISRSWALKLAKKSITGPGLEPREWNYTFGSIAERVAPHPTNPGAPTCLNDGCVGGHATATVTGPAFLENNGYAKREWSRFTFGNSFGYNEGKLLKVEKGYVPILGGSAVTLERVETGYALPEPVPNFVCEA